jgi:2-succinyl-6-hydroxy-2,4-cyclohexadiene-1-carboxylate synthase
MPETLLLLHGFSQTGRSWDGVLARLEAQRYRPLAPDLHRGRPHADLPSAAQALAATAGDGPFALVGYSMGGRLALHVALACPDRVTRLVLVSTTAGIEDAGERAARRAVDEALAARIEAGPIARFADAWAAGPLFAGQPPAVAAAARVDRLRNDPAALAVALRSLGTGTMVPVWDRLAALSMPVAVLAGERDAKFTALAWRLAAGIPGATCEVVAGAGHDVVREAPDAVAGVVSA